MPFYQKSIDFLQSPCLYFHLNRESLFSRSLSRKPAPFPDFPDNPRESIGKSLEKQKSHVFQNGTCAHLGDTGTGPSVVTT